jgi:di/tricarboxylate transporter
MASKQAESGKTPGTAYQKKQPGFQARILTILAAIIVCFAIMYLPIPDILRTVRGSLLDPKGQKALGVLAFALILWIFEALPFHVTGLLSILALSLVGAGDFQAVMCVTTNGTGACGYDCKTPNGRAPRLGKADKNRLLARRAVADLLAWMAAAGLTPAQAPPEI